MLNISAQTTWFNICIEGASDFNVYNFKGCEEINEPYCFEIELVSRNANEDINFLLGCQTLLTVQDHSGLKRKIHGQINQTRQLHTANTFTHYQITLVPRFWFLGLNNNHRIFQHKSVPTIIYDILKEQLFMADAYEFELKEEYEERNYCVQYNESDLAFISRLCEEEGIYFYFTHLEDKHILCFSDASGGDFIESFTSDGLIRFHPGSGQTAETAVINKLNFNQQVNSDSAIYREWNFEKPSLDLEVFKNESSQANTSYEEARTAYDTASKNTETKKATLTALKDARDKAKTNYDELNRRRTALVNADGIEDLSNQSCDFEDEYNITVEALPEAITDTHTSPIPPSTTTYENVHSKIHVAIVPPLKTDPTIGSNKVIISLKVSLATFSLDLPYMSQVAGSVDLTQENVLDSISTSETLDAAGFGAWQPVSLTPATEPAVTEPAATPVATGTTQWVGRPNATRGSAGNPKRGEYLCSPTTVTMMMRYYGVMGNEITNLQARADIMAAHANRSGSTNPTDSNPWTDWGNSRAICTYLVNNIFSPNTIENLIALQIDPTANTVANFLPRIMPYLACGHPFYASILGGHIVSVRGVVLDHAAENIWSICNDPYGNLAGPQSDYSLYNRFASYYQGDYGQLSGTRKERNSNSGENANRGEQVYYNGETHTRTSNSGTGAHLYFRMGVYFTYRHPNDVTMLTKDFTKKKLLKGE